ncbi:PREDICTED: leptin isoform X3 [Hipposideros armiger]|uniref:Leptin n=1 Tax=Hipposideros armiger TaxID=186990 RepID=A0A8B7RN73_HIPAR|nr:PREDICTED: leptin isoform X3 [Hipposideros armiger]XP_019501718.1 PREDICTED: leptin isoform X3 [Hipposideros armiger]XP_019501719.1 PREDICTED: leptin isoform X3 [Hipposideros armiger]XP_019501720.1 PREDICTED: leptin isoform X3 [Hipposideros armiger]XP_019501721.1 PREDICTED: leptin isoform X3 [Hipposideros armiger]XP_019501722.1 PREDICTED: leptin isoform X3 [Hipposideros armiger]XP_019501723.1 PREDICTED: leptin isoform X3 [Hipposideros armiger]
MKIKQMGTRPACPHVDHDLEVQAQEAHLEGRMRCGPLCQLLWLWLCLSYIEAVPTQKIQDDTKVLIKTIITRINGVSHMQSVSKYSITGLDFLPGFQSALSLSMMNDILETYQKILINLPSRNLMQISNDMENLQHLLQLLASSRGCHFTQVPGLNSLKGSILEASLYSTEVVVLNGLKAFLQQMLRQLDFSPEC